MTSKSAMRVYTDDDFWIVARSPDDALDVCREMHGDFDHGHGPFRVCPSDQPFTLRSDDGTIETKAFAEWAATERRGLLTWADGHV